MLLQNILIVTNTWAHLRHDLLNWTFETSFWNAKTSALWDMLLVLFAPKLWHIFYMGNWLNFWDFELAISRDRVTFELHLNCIFLLFNMLFQMSLFSRYSDFFFSIYWNAHTHTQTLQSLHFKWNRFQTLNSISKIGQRKCCQYSLYELVILLHLC